MDFKECKNTDNTPCEGSLDVGRGCRFCRCDGEATASACEGCYKLHSFNWLEDMPEVFPTDIFEVRFKNTRKSYYRNVNNLPREGATSSPSRRRPVTISGSSR